MIAPRSLTPDVQLRLATLDDDIGLADAYVRSWDHLKEWEPDRADSWFTPAGQRERLTGTLERYKDGRTVPWVLVEGERILGGITLNDLVPGPFRSSSLGYWLAVDRVGRGLMTRAVETVAEIADTELKLHRIEASTRTDNVASQKVLHRTGFTQIGTAPTYLHIAGAWRDHHLFQRVLNDRAPGA
ncbi:GNAT family N-acetyltransferase [Kribbella sp. CA-247076]|uniref:GNAT family N-acetyltransferase n=1 Tax=Kribbella sp. CA-247076 TaxID=3239941 RepID=UPI003D90EA00